MKRRNKKGFTLVELMIVIVIIGILAAILIPTISNAIQDARYSNDQADARNMTTVLQTYCIKNDIEVTELEAPEVRALVGRGDKAYSFAPSSKNAIFWFNKANGSISVNRTEDYTVSRINSVYAATANVGSSLEEIVSGYLYLNTDGEIANLFNSIRNITSQADFNAISSTTEIAGLDVAAILNEYAPSKTLYIGSTGMFTGATLAEGSRISRVVFAPGISVISNSTGTGMKFADDVEVRIPATVSVVEPLAFVMVSSQTKFTVASNSTMVVEGALSQSIKTTSNIENVSSQEYIDAVRGNQYVEIEVVGYERSCKTTDKSNQEISIGALGKIDLTNAYVVDGKNCLSLIGEETSAKTSVSLQINQIMIDTTVLMENCPSITTVDIKYQPRNNNIVDIYIRAFDADGIVVNIVVSFKQA